MPTPRPTLRQLEYFAALADELNFRRAAEACYVTQPALSSQIAQLEGTLGVQLFERDRRQVRLTPIGEALLADARAILARTDQLAETARASGAPLAGPLRLGTIPTVGPYLLPKVLPSVQRAFPKLRLYLREDLTTRLVEQLDSGELDVLLLAIDVELGDLETMPLFSDPFLVALARGDALAGRSELTLEDLAERDVLLLDEGHCLRDQTLPLCESVGGTELPGFRASSLGTVVQMVAGGLGVTFLPELAVEREAAATPGLCTVGFGAHGPSRQIGLAWRRSSARADEFRALGRALAKAWAET